MTIYIILKFFIVTLLIFFIVATSLYWFKRIREKDITDKKRLFKDLLFIVIAIFIVVEKIIELIKVLSSI